MGRTGHWRRALKSSSLLILNEVSQRVGVGHPTKSQHLSILSRSHALSSLWSFRKFRPSYIIVLGIVYYPVGVKLVHLDYSWCGMVFHSYAYAFNGFLVKLPNTYHQKTSTILRFITIFEITYHSIHIHLQKKKKKNNNENKNKIKLLCQTVLCFQIIAKCCKHKFPTLWWTNSS